MTSAVGLARPRIRVDRELGRQDRGLAQGLLVTVLDQLKGMKDGELLGLESAATEVPGELRKWAGITGHGIFEEAGASGVRRLIVRHGAVPNLSAHRASDERRIWLYSNFDCNLSCDYCCVRSSPHSARRTIATKLARRVAIEAKALGFDRVFVTGGEPLLRPDIAAFLQACTDALPTTVLTNGTLLSGPRGRELEGLSRERLAFQVSLDSPSPEINDRHRGLGSWEKAVEGIDTLRARGFRVRVAATIADQSSVPQMVRFLADRGVPPEDRVIRPLARRGNAESGWTLHRAALEPELTITDQGAYWHPVGADDDDFRVSAEVLPLADVVSRIETIQASDRRQGSLGGTEFSCG
jgi:molybdenum cofactor biosynthesis enzyme MoaA